MLKGTAPAPQSRLTGCFMSQNQAELRRWTLDLDRSRFHTPHFSKEHMGEHLCKEQGKRMKRQITPYFFLVSCQRCVRENKQMFSLDNLDSDQNAL